MRARNGKRSPGKVTLGRASVVGLAGITAASGVAVAGASASSRAQRAHVSHHKAKNTSNASVEKSLKSLESPPSSKTPITEAGSSLVYPLMAAWAPAFPGRSMVPVSPAAGGSGKGIAYSIAGTVNIGASDAYLPPSDTSVENIPVAISAQMINYNIPGLSKHVHLRLNAKVLNDIYTGKVTMWNAKEIRSLNSGVKIPAVRIVPLHRSDGSGDTFLFSSYLAAGDHSSFVASTGPQTLVNFPNVQGALGENGNTGMLQTCATTKGCVAYIGISYLNSAIQANGLGLASLENGKGQYLLPTASTMHSEVVGIKHVPGSGSVSLIDLKASDGYPIVNFEYAIVAKNQPSADTAKAVKSFLAWAMDPQGGSSQKYLVPVHFQPLPANALKVAVALLKNI